MTEITLEESTETTAMQKKYKIVAEIISAGKDERLAESYFTLPEKYHQASYLEQLNRTIELIQAGVNYLGSMTEEPILSEAQILKSKLEEVLETKEKYLLEIKQTKKPNSYKAGNGALGIVNG